MLDRPFLTIIAFMLVCTGTVLHIVGMTTPEWSVYPFSQRGPFTSCDHVSCIQTSSFVQNYNVEAVRGLTMTAMVLAILAAVVIVYMLLKPDLNILPAVAAGLTLAGFIFILIAISIWSSDVNEDSVVDFGYSFVLTVVGGTVFLIGGMVAVCAGRAY